jgi:F-type H+-transporting ATPase subunit gamma
VERILLVFPSYRSRLLGYEPVTLQLAPTDRHRLERLATRPWPSRVLPIYAQGWDGLVAELIRQAMFVRLHHTFAQTMASVSASRLTAMDAAQHDIEQRLAALRMRHQQLRQAEITEEILDVVSGFEVLQAQ